MLVYLFLGLEMCKDLGGSAVFSVAQGLLVSNGMVEEGFEGCQNVAELVGFLIRVVLFCKDSEIEIASESRKNSKLYDITNFVQDFSGLLLCSSAPLLLCSSAHWLLSHWLLSHWLLVR